VAELPALTDDGPVITRENALVIVTMAVELLELSSMLVACTDTEPAAGTIAGAV
jgi:hypothetical protein